MSPAAFPLTFDETRPDGATVSARAIDTEIQQVTKEFDALLGLGGTGTSFVLAQAAGPIAWLTNKTAASVANRNVVAIDTANDDSVGLSDVSGSWRPFLAYIGNAAIADAAAGAFVSHGLVTLTSTGVIARGQYIRKSATTLAVEDAGTAQAAAALIPPGTIGVATQAAAAGAVKAYLFGLSWPGAFRTNQQNALQLDPYGTGAGNTGEIRFLELAANGTNYVGFKAADSLAGNVIWTLPSADGTASQVIQTNASGVLSFATASSGLTRRGGQTTEATTTATTTTALLTISGLSIPAASPILVVFSFRKTAPGTASTLAFALDVNATTSVIAAARLAADENTARNGVAVLVIGPRVTNYTTGIMVYGPFTSNDQSGVATWAAMPIATVTDLVLRAHNGGTGGAATIGYDEAHVYELATS